jgi:tetratricopeptide (TPR) repeat protein
MNEESRTVREIESRLDGLKQEVDALQVKVLSETAPWYRQASTLIAFFALVFSFGTTVISYQRAAEQDERSLKQELRGLILQLVQLPLRGIELNEKYKEQPLFLGGISAVFNHESLILADQAATVAERIPHLVSSAEYITLANAFQNGGQLERASAMRRRAIEVAEVPIDAINALRQQGGQAYQQGNLEVGRAYFRDAIDLLDQSEVEIDPGVKAFTNAFTEMFWAQMESTVGQCEEFRQHIASARGFADGVPPIGREQVMAQIRETEASGCPRAVFGQP